MIYIQLHDMIYGTHIQCCTNTETTVITTDGCSHVMIDLQKNPKSTSCYCLTSDHCISMRRYDTDCRIRPIVFGSSALHLETHMLIAGISEEEMTGCPFTKWTYIQVAIIIKE